MLQNLTQLLREKVSQYGDRQAFKYKIKDNNKYESISWNNLLFKTNQVSKALISMNFGYNDKIGILSNNKPEWTISDLGIISIRSIVVPLYATSSKNDIKYIIDETKMKLLFWGINDQIEKGLWLLDNCETLEKIILFDNNINIEDKRFIKWNDFLILSQEKSLESKLDQAITEIKPDDIATIIYTSGTTGEPKGAMLGHDNFIQAFLINNERLNITENDVSLCFLPLSHVFERTWTYFLLFCGATNVFLENPREVIDVLPIIKPTVMCTVPRFFEKTYDGIQQEAQKWPAIKRNIFKWSVKVGHKYIEYKKDSKKAPGYLEFKNKIADKLVLQKLRSVFGGKIKAMPCAGAAIDPKILRFFHAAGIFINYGYGATETTATVSCFRSDKYNFDYCGSIMPDVSIQISDKNEIMIKGKTIFKGYYNKPEETVKVFHDNWYLTGDEGYVVNSEYLVMTDRLKDLIKTSIGKYISPQKIELLLSQDKYIEQVVIIGDNRKYVTALIVPSFESLKNTLNLNDTTNQSVVLNQNAVNFIQQRIDNLQLNLAPYEKVVKFTLLSESFNIDNNTLTNTLKIRRKVIEQKYTDIINEMYLSA